MRLITSYHKLFKIQYIKAALFTLFIVVLFADKPIKLIHNGNNYFHVTLNGVDVGTVSDPAKAEDMLRSAHKTIAQDTDGLMFLEADMDIWGEEIFWGHVDSPEIVLSKMEEVLREGISVASEHAYIVKIDDFMLALRSEAEVNALLQTAIAKYDSEDAFTVSLVQDKTREFNVLTTAIERNNGLDDDTSDYMSAGVQDILSGNTIREKADSEKLWSDFNYGIRSLGFVQKIEVAEAFIPESELTPLDVAIEEVTKEQAKPSTYTVVKGDTLSAISLNVNIPMDTIVAMNPNILKTANSILHIGDELIITIPEPELSVTRVETKYYEEVYDADTIYQYNDSWYTNQSKILQQPSSGFRKVVADISYLNSNEVGREILKEEIVVEATPLVLEKGTKIPPTYVWPLSGSPRVTSSFGWRAVPTAGASSNHAGMDFGVVIGTPVYASSGGTVTVAGAVSGYGYAVYIKHPDGKETRYGHLSKVLVSVGDKVSQSQKIALSGNSGVTTGPHLHFEIRQNGTPVNPNSVVNK